MPIDATQTEETVIIDLSKDKLLGFRHVETDATETGFVDDAAATFNKIGEPIPSPAD